MTARPRTGRRRRPVPAASRGAAGQAAVELALVLPLVVVLLLVVVQVALLVRDQILVVHAAREAARAVAVEPAPDAGRRAAVAGSGLAPDRLEVEVGGRGGAGSRARVVVRYRAPTAVPIVGGMAGDVTLSAGATIRVER